ncbi:hypothetical protein H072_8796 [Dactylellina haptotyla CBS 200.50]|uniref:Extracellular membrane protein CFEM domain-containing protein n=1 Tax=Dactylellina haptotyla (strain CBS 200.50) TaxID=1284197 RepID=S8BQL8_DACHA|nr:hypothetical protein H072_8796 [Dactylellina haptotyla CBS 200.50]
MASTKAIFLALHILSIIILINPTAVAQDPIPVIESYKITNALSYNYLRTCGLCCLGVGFCYDAQRLTNVLACTVNSCLCRRADISTSALSYISSCVNSACSANQEDVNQYQGVYQNYCASYLGEAVPSGTDAATTVVGGGGATVTQAAPASTVTKTDLGTVTSMAVLTSTLPDGSVTSFTSAQTILVVTATANPSTAANSTTKVAIGIGLGIGIPILAAIIIFGLILVRRQRNPEMPIIGGAQMQSGNHMPMSYQSQVIAPKPIKIIANFTGDRSKELEHCASSINVENVSTLEMVEAHCAYWEVIAPTAENSERNGLVWRDISPELQQEAIENIIKHSEYPDIVEANPWLPLKCIQIYMSNRRDLLNSKKYRARSFVGDSEQSRTGNDDQRLSGTPDAAHQDQKRPLEPPAPLQYDPVRDC